MNLFAGFSSINGYIDVDLNLPRKSLLHNSLPLEGSAASNGETSTRYFQRQVNSGIRWGVSKRKGNEQFIESDHPIELVLLGLKWRGVRISTRTRRARPIEKDLSLLIDDSYPIISKIRRRSYVQFHHCLEILAVVPKSGVADFVFRTWSSEAVK